MLTRLACAILMFAVVTGFSARAADANPTPPKADDPTKANADDAAKAKADAAKKKADDDKKKLDDEVAKRVAAETKKALAEEAKKKAAEEKAKKAAEAAKHAEEEKKKQDDPANWKPRDFAALKTTGSSFCAFIKDASRKKNEEAAIIEGKEILGNSDVRLKLRAFQRVKIKNDGTDAKEWPQEWLKRAENGAVLVLVSGDGQQIVILDSKTTKGMTASGFQALLEPMLKHDNDLKASAALHAKDEFERKTAEAARATAAANVPGLPAEDKKLPGLDGAPKKLADKTDKPKKKGPEDE